MKENEWINIRQELPKIDQLVEVSFSVRGKLFEVERVKFSINKNGFIGFIGSTELMCNIDSILGWRPIPEKRPDFSKLNRGDLIYIFTEDKAYRKVGYFFETDMSCDDLITSEYEDVMGSYDNTDINEITKITRINIEEKTFEEI